MLMNRAVITFIYSCCCSVHFYETSLAVNLLFNQEVSSFHNLTVGRKDRTARRKGTGRKGGSVGNEGRDEIIL